MSIFLKLLTNNILRLNIALEVSARTDDSHDFQAIIKVVCIDSLHARFFVVC